MSRVKHLWGWLAGAVVVLGLLAATLNWTGVRHQLALSFTRIPERYTALYFPPDPVHDGSNASAGRRIDVGFFVGNHEGHPVDYSFLVTALERGGGSRSVHGEAHVAADQTVELHQVLVPTGDWTKISVQLLGRTERLQFFNPRQP